MSLSHHAVLSGSELVAKADARIDIRGSVARIGVRGAGRASDVGAEEAVGQTVVDLRPHHAGIHVYVLGKAPIENQRDGVQRARAARRGRRVASARRVGAVADDEAVLPLMVVGTGDVDGRRDRVTNAEPSSLQY